MTAVALLEEPEQEGRAKHLEVVIGFDALAVGDAIRASRCPVCVPDVPGEVLVYHRCKCTPRNPLALSDADYKLLFALISWCAKFGFTSKGFTYVGLETLAFEAKVSLRTAKRSVARLRTDGGAADPAMPPGVWLEVHNRGDGAHPTKHPPGWQDAQNRALEKKLKLAPGKLGAGSSNVYRVLVPAALASRPPAPPPASSPPPTAPSVPPPASSPRPPAPARELAPEGVDQPFPSDTRSRTPPASSPASSIEVAKQEAAAGTWRDFREVFEGAHGAKYGAGATIRDPFVEERVAIVAAVERLARAQSETFRTAALVLTLEYLKKPGDKGYLARKAHPLSKLAEDLDELSAAAARELTNRRREARPLAALRAAARVSTADKAKGAREVLAGIPGGRRARGDP